MDDLIEFVCDFFAIKATSKIAAIDMATELSAIQSHGNYVKFLKSHINLIGMEYLPAYQKFVKLTEQYRKLELEVLNKTKIEKMGSAAERLASKVKEIDTMVINNQSVKHTWDGFKVEGECYFSDKEQKALLTIGTPLHCVRLQRQISGRDLLCEKLESLFIERVVYPQIESTTQSGNLISNLASVVTARR